MYHRRKQYYYHTTIAMYVYLRTIERANFRPQCEFPLRHRCVRVSNGMYLMKKEQGVEKDVTSPRAEEHHTEGKDYQNWL
jgi:hypothetical protein